ncbi:glutaredoxin domain-containing protein [Pseudahrensia aquimaris]|uniref:Glutaredoxin 1 n=1 Tax=Pseudahrensia aquimaris TaxID=744461 RepID=A0ABW3FL39_9HYPH
MAHKIQVFTKPDCPYCAKVKATLDNAGLPFSELDVTGSDRNADLSVYLSGVSTVPQTFIGPDHVNGSTDFVALHAAGRLVPLVATATEPLDIDAPSNQEVADGAEDYQLRRVIPERDGSRSDVEEDWPILRMYKEFFGFWPNCFYYQYHWPEVAYRQFVYCHNVGAIAGGKKVLGAPVMNALGYATSNAQGCNYCQAHSVSVGDEKSAGYAKGIEQALDGDFSGEFGPFEAALADLVAHASTNTVTENDFAKIRENGGEARFTKLPVEANIQAASMIAAAFGFLNVFNDLTGVKVEADWAKKAEEGAGIETGRHGASEDRDSTNLDYDLPEGGPSMTSMIARYGKDVLLAGGPARYATEKLGIQPDWMAQWPLPLRPLHAKFYVGAMTDEESDGVSISSELKHLMARVSHIAKGNDYLAAVEGWLAWHAAGRTQDAVERVRHAFDAAKRQDNRNLFTARECAALELARLSAQVPLTTPRRFVQAAIDHFDPTELVHLITVCAMASMIQRFAAISKPKVETEVRRFLDENDLSLDTLAIRYPLPEPKNAFNSGADFVAA